jgi:hypothetical protein
MIFKETYLVEKDLTQYHNSYSGCYDLRTRKDYQNKFSKREILAAIETAKTSYLKFIFSPLIMLHLTILLRGLLCSENTK